MRKTARIKLFIIMTAIGLMVAFGFRPSRAQASTAQQSPPAQEKPGEQKPAAPETLQVLKAMTRQQILAEMRKVSAAMGTECNFCHVNPFSAETARKSVARLMMRDYTMGLKHKDGSALSCNDCHKG